jgi:hypothetical protein
VCTPTPDLVAEAFDLGRPTGELVHVRRGDTDTWRLETTKGSHFIKGYRPTTSGQFVAGGLQAQLEVAMDFERRALEAGVAMGEPVAPTDPLAGWVTRIDERLFRAYRWVEHRPLRPDDDVALWLGRTMAQIHQIEPVGEIGLPACRTGGVGRSGHARPGRSTSPRDNALAGHGLTLHRIGCRSSSTCRYVSRNSARSPRTA